jgi:hypothetical protein
VGSRPTECMCNLPIKENIELLRCYFTHECPKKSFNLICSKPILTFPQSFVIKMSSLGLSEKQDLIDWRKVIGNDTKMDFNAFDQSNCYE